MLNTIDNRLILKALIDVMVQKIIEDYLTSLANNVQVPDIQEREFVQINQMPLIIVQVLLLID
jgi:hypothetical protein